jgi:hypothetical protein
MEIIKNYLEAWNTDDAADRRALLDRIWAEDGTYTDPLADVTGAERFDEVIGAVRAQFPGLVFTLGGDVDAHHGLARFTWLLGPEGGEPLVIGFDVAVIENDRIKHVLGFLDRVPA